MLSKDSSGIQQGGMQEATHSNDECTATQSEHRRWVGYFVSQSAPCTLQKATMMRGRC